MTRKHFAAIANALFAERQRQLDAKNLHGLAAVDLVGIHLAAVFREFNEQFDRQRFLAACRGGSDAKRTTPPQQPRRTPE